MPVLYILNVEAFPIHTFKLHEVFLLAITAYSYALKHVLSMLSLPFAQKM